MVQVIGPGTRKPSFGEKLSAGIGRGLEFGQQMMQEHQAKQAQALQGQQISQLVGADVSNLDPELQKVALQLTMQGKNQQVAELLKQEGQKQRLGEKQDFLSKIFGGGQKHGIGQPQQPGQIPQEMTSAEGFQQQGGFDPLQLSDADIAQATALDPTLGRELRAAKDSALKESRFEKEFAERQKEKSPEYLREKELTHSQAQADVKYNTALQEASKQHELKERTLDRLEQLNKKGVTGKPWEKFAEKIGLVNVTSEGRREFAADVKNLITDIRSILGAQFTGFEFQTILNAYPSADFSKEANTAIIRNLKEFQEIKKKEVEFAEQLKKENKGKIPLDFQAKVNEKVRDYASSRMPEIKENTRKIMNEEYGIPEGFTLMFDPQGNEMSVPESEIANLLEQGATLP